jgi:hypothetical protein
MDFAEGRVNSGHLFANRREALQESYFEWAARERTFGPGLRQFTEKTSSPNLSELEIPDHPAPT